MTIFDYYFVDVPGQRRQLRRFGPGHSSGERFDFTERKWTPECCSRAACELTGDRRINQQSAEAVVNYA